MGLFTHKRGRKRFLAWTLQMLWICFLRLQLHIGKGLGGVGKEGLSITKVFCKMNSSFEDMGPFSNQTRAQGSTCVQFHSEITLIQSYPLSPCVTTLWHWMIKYSWKNVQGVCFSSTVLCICKTCDQMFMPGSYWRFVYSGVLGVFGMPCVMVLTLGKSKRG